MAMNFWGETDKGKVRKRNEDGFEGVINQNTLFLITADGFGIDDGKDGQTAGSVAVTEVKRFIEKYYMPTSVDYVKNFIKQCFDVANRVILAYRKANFDLYSGYGSSLTICAVLTNRQIIIGHAGSVRLYLVRDGKALRGTKEHNLAQKLLDEGKIKPTEYMDHPDRIILTNGLGNSDELNIDLTDAVLQQNDILMLVTDGIYNLITDDEIAYVIREAGDIKESAKWLVKNANERGGFDNVTAVVSYINF